MTGPAGTAWFFAGAPVLAPAAAVVPEQVIAVVAQPVPEDPGGRGADFGKSSPLGLLVLILFFIAVALLVRSMTKHLKRVPASFDREPVPSARERGTHGDPDDSAGRAEQGGADRGGDTDQGGGREG